MKREYPGRAILIALIAAAGMAALGTSADAPAAQAQPRSMPVFETDPSWPKIARDLALSPDREQQFLYVGGGKGIVVVDRKTLEVVGTIEIPGQLGPGQHIATDSKGNIYIAQTSAGIQKLVFKGMSAPGL